MPPDSGEVADFFSPDDFHGFHMPVIKSCRCHIYMSGLQIYQIYFSNSKHLVLVLII